MFRNVRTLIRWQTLFLAAKFSSRTSDAPPGFAPVRSTTKRCEPWSGFGVVGPRLTESNRASDIAIRMSI
jgi:hypothetical protein